MGHLPQRRVPVGPQPATREWFHSGRAKFNINPLSLGFNPLAQVITPNLFPGVSISADLGNGPGEPWNMQ